MVNQTLFTYPSRDGIHNCQAYKWEDDSTPVRAVVQIVHGMQEHMGRYNEFAEFLCKSGFLVVGNDHLGHGKTASADELGYFAKDNADVMLVRDVHRLKKITEKEHPGIPYFILGHSMGSFITRKYLTMYGKGITGAIICGTGVKPGIVTGTGKFVSSLFGVFAKGRNTSRFIANTSFKGYNSRITDSDDPNAWVVRNDKILKAYNEDPLCGFPFTTNGYRTLFTILHFVDKEKNLALIPKNLPIFIISGLEDPVGDYGEAPLKVCDMYTKAGIEDVSIKLYENMRHEILNDIECETVFADIIKWLDDKIKSRK